MYTVHVPISFYKALISKYVPEYEFIITTIFLC